MTKLVSFEYKGKENKLRLTETFKMIASTGAKVWNPPKGLKVNKGRKHK